MHSLPRKGLRFVHRFWLDENNNPLTFEVTRIARGTVYYRGIYDGKIGGAPMCCDVDQFPRYVKDKPQDPTP